MYATCYFYNKHRICTIYIFKIFNFLVKSSGTHIFFHSIYVNLKMNKMIALNTEIINRQDGNVEHKGIILCLETYKFLAIKISGNRNQCLQYCLNAFYHDVDDFKKATILWSVAHWGQYAVCRTNDNTFVFNRML